MGEKIMKKMMFFFITVTVLTGCMTVHKDLTNDPRFKEVVAKTHQIKDDLVLTQSQDSKEILAEEFGQQGVPTKEEIKNIFPYRYESNVIHGVLKKGTLFKVIKVTYMNNFETSQTYYSAKILSEGSLKDKIIDVSLIASGGDVPKFDEKYAVEVK
jgi:hypothetical protein